MEVGTDVPWFVLKRRSEGDTLASHVTVDFCTFCRKYFFQEIYTNYMSFDSDFNADDRGLT